MTLGRVALIAGSTGVVGRNLGTALTELGWTVYGLAQSVVSGRNNTDCCRFARSYGAKQDTFASGTDSRFLSHVASTADRARECSRQRRNDGKPTFGAAKEIRSGIARW